MASSKRSFSGTGSQPTIFALPTRYDIHLGIIPLVFSLAVLIGWLTGVPLTVTLAGASLVGFLVIADALFRYPPLSCNR